MTIEFLKEKKCQALKDGDKLRNMVIGEMIDAIQKASMAGKSRVEITDKLVDETLIKVQKTFQEMVDTCPTTRVDLLDNYNAQLTIVKEFAPQLITDEAVIKAMIQGQIFSTGLAFTKKNKGSIMKIIMPVVRGKADMKIVNKVIESMFE